MANRHYLTKDVYFEEDSGVWKLTTTAGVDLTDAGVIDVGGNAIQYSTGTSLGSGVEPQSSFTLDTTTGTVINSPTGGSHDLQIAGVSHLEIDETAITAAVPFKPAQMDTTTRVGLTPSEGMVVYDTDLERLCLYTDAWYLLDMTAEV